jgi:GrpB-like predicted nucleotidyltransferase (UPF0157 family)
MSVVAYDPDWPGQFTAERNLGVHVHICAEGSDWERRHLPYRDWLRRDEAGRSAYAALKHELAAQTGRT